MFSTWQETCRNIRTCSQDQIHPWMIDILCMCGTSPAPLPYWSVDCRETSPRLLRRRAELSTHQIKPAQLYRPRYTWRDPSLSNTPCPCSSQLLHNPSCTSQHCGPPSFSLLLYAQILLSVWVFLNISWKPNPAGSCLLGPALRSSPMFVSILQRITYLIFFVELKARWLFCRNLGGCKHDPSIFLTSLP